MIPPVRPGPWRRCFRWIKRIFIAVLLLVLTALLSGFICQQVASRIGDRRFPPPGRMVDVGGHRLHILRLGRGSPAVVFDSPMGASHLAWSLVQPRVAAFTEACAYDRAGSGWSEPGLGPRTSSKAAEELHALLKNAGVKPPYILVGSSIGGLNVRLYAFRFPGEVAGLVLVDPAHEEQSVRLPPSAQLDPSFIRMLRLARLGSRLGLLRLLNMPLGEASSPLLPAELRPMARAAGFRSSWVDALYREAIAIEASFAEARSARRALNERPLGDIPLVVLTRSEAETAAPHERRAWRIWRELHLEIARESGRGEQETVPGSGHFIQADRPEAVIQAIRKLVAAGAGS
ncbi:MAG: alpha/beta hydrolase [Candidatus Aminicenantes bacterium]|nr:alpha/beta hydrolase [Candidatus Aminicenantes bacterium]